MNTTAQAQKLTEAELRNIDFHVVVDTSGSMGKASTRFKGRTRLQEVMEDCLALSRLAEKYDSDGITVIQYSGAARTFDGVKSDTVEKVFQEMDTRGSTNMVAALEQVALKARASEKETVVLFFTDGEPDDEHGTFEFINKLGKELGRPKIGFTFIQVGDDPDSTAFLQKLDGGLQVDVVAAVSAKDAESLDISQIAWLARNA